MTSGNDRHLMQEVSTIMDSAARLPTVKATCDRCEQEREYAPTALGVNLLETTNYHLGYSYEFFCTACHCHIRHPVTKGVFDILIAASVPSRTVVGPDEVADIHARKDHKLLNGDDLLTLLTGLYDENPSSLEQVTDNER